MIKKINYGCGKDYKKGWINIDINDKWSSNIKKPDLIIKKNQINLPFENNSIDYILLDNVLEHIDPNKITPLLLEFYRILKKKGILRIYVPHFKSIAIKFLEHIKCYGINSFWYFEKYFNIQQKLFLISRNSNFNFKILKFLNNFNFFFNFNPLWQQFCEKFLPGGFEEIRYIMEKK
jgi:predicted SAM-dependent methyltransferase